MAEPLTNGSPQVPIMHRRKYLHTLVSVSFASLVAGCTGDRGASDEPAEETAEGPTERVVVATGGDGGAAASPLSETDAPAIEIDETKFERVGPNEFVVDGVVRNVGDQAFDHLEIDARLYESGGGEEGFFDEAERNRELEYMAATEAYTFRLHFDDVEIEDVSHYSITASATLANSTS